MNQNQQVTPIVELRAKRDSVLSLAKLQFELRELVKQYMAHESLTVAMFANQTELPWKTIHQLVEGERGFGVSGSLRTLTKHLDRPDLYKKFEDATRGLNDRLVGVSLLPYKVIHLAFDVHEVYADECLEQPHALFVSAFDGLEDVVMGIMVWRLEDLRRLQDEKTFERLERMLLSDELSPKLAAIVRSHEELLQALAAEFRALAEKLLHGSVTQRKLAKSLDTSASLVGYALMGKVSRAKLDELIVSAKEKLAEAEKRRENRARANGKPADKQPDAPPKTEPVAKAKSDRPKTSDNPSAEPAKRLTAVIARLRTVYGSEPRLAQDLKLSVRHLHDAMNGAMSVDATENVFRRATALVNRTFPSRPLALAAPQPQAKPPSQPPTDTAAASQTQADQDCAPEPTTTNVVAAADPVPTPEQPEPAKSLSLELIAATDETTGIWPVGRESADGVPYTLDSIAFRPFEYRPTPDELKFAARQIQHVRAMLNVLTQIKDDGIRAQVRQTLGHEVEELGMTLRVFTDEFPNRMIGLYDAERVTMRVLGMDAKPSKKGNR